MKAHHILIYLGMLALLLIVALVSGRIEDESQRVEFTTWAPLVALVAPVAVFVLWRFVLRRSNRGARAAAPRGDVVPVVEVVTRKADPPRMRPVFTLVSIAGVFVVVSGSVSSISDHSRVRSRRRLH
jgi:peptidoglycan/LPS O-acetylase OafA/YrhL